jgi:hypothetical protein
MDADKLKQIDVDFDKATARIAPERGKKPRIFKLS